MEKPALPLLTADLKTVGLCLVDVSNPRNAQTLVVVATGGVSLVKTLELYNYNFAGTDFDIRLHYGVGNVVRAASDLLSAIALSRPARPVLAS